jgi:hypothetical protein
MTRFQVCSQKQRIIGGAIYIHARLKAARPTGWSVVGVFQLTLDEWQELTGYCDQLGIQVVQDAEESSVSS